MDSKPQDLELNLSEEEGSMLENKFNVNGQRPQTATNYLSRRLDDSKRNRYLNIQNQDYGNLKNKNQILPKKKFTSVHTT